MDNRPIGIFDSGVGGLTVMKAVVNLLPQEDIFYLADTMNMPYGNKTKEQLCRYTRQAMNYFLTHDVKLVVFACNTLSSVVLESIRQEYELPILGTVKAGAQAALTASASKNIGVLATVNTVATHAYAKQINSLDTQARVSERACDPLAAMIEAGQTEGRPVEMVLQAVLTGWNLDTIDALVLGCTHFPFIRPLLASYLPSSVNIIDPAAATAREVANWLQKQALEHAADIREANKSFSVSGDPDAFFRVGHQLLPDLVTAAERVVL